MGPGEAADGQRGAPGPKAQADAWLVPRVEVACLPGQGTPPESGGVAAQLLPRQPAGPVPVPKPAEVGRGAEHGGRAWLSRLMALLKRERTTMMIFKNCIQEDKTKGRGGRIFSSRGHPGCPHRECPLRTEEPQV